MWRRGRPASSYERMCPKCVLSTRKFSVYIVAACHSTSEWSNKWNSPSDSMLSSLFHDVSYECHVFALPDVNFHHPVTHPRNIGLCSLLRCTLAPSWDGEFLILLHRWKWNYIYSVFRHDWLVIYYDPTTSSINFLLFDFLMHTPSTDCLDLTSSPWSISDQI